MSEQRIGGTGFEGMAGPGRERRRQARAYVRWHALREGGGLPRVAGFLVSETAADDGCAYLALSETVGDGRFPRELAASLDRHRARLLDAAPMAFRFDGTHERREGLLLPLADAGGRLAGFAVIDHAFEAAERAAGPVARLGAVPRAPNPWGQTVSGAVALAGRGRAEALPFATRLAAAQTWVALAMQGPLPTRASGMHAALCAAFELLLRAEGDGPAWQALGNADGIGDQATVIAGALFPETEAEDVTLALTHARRLGLDAAGFGALLVASGGHEALVAAERRWDAHGAGAEPIAIEPILELSPVDHGFLMRLAQRASLRPDEVAPARAAA